MSSDMGIPISAASARLAARTRGSPHVFVAMTNTSNSAPRADISSTEPHRHHAGDVRTKNKT
jgi:hypothetical protein